MIETKNRVLASATCALTLISAGVLFGACGGTDGSSLINGSPSDASTDDGATADGSASGDGSTTPNDGGEITDGGENFGDAGRSDGGDFPDGGSCNRTAMAASFMSDCTAIPAFSNGGQLQNGTYDLTKVTDLGSFSFCQNTFVPVSFQGGLVVSSGPDGSSDLELALDGDMSGRKSFSWIATPAKTNKSPLTIVQSCPSATTFTLPYNVTNSSALSKQAIEIEAPYGTAGANAVYHFDKE